MIGPAPTHTLLFTTVAQSDNHLFHTGCVYLPRLDELYTTSSLLQAGSGSLSPAILISHVKLFRDVDGEIDRADWLKLRPPKPMYMPAGAMQYSKGVLYCSQGNWEPGTGGLYYMPEGKPPQAVVTSYHGRDFNSPYDVTCASDGSFWFTDPCFGHESDFRDQPQLPCHVYRYVPAESDLRVVADGLGRPMGVCFSPDFETFYVTDADALRPDGLLDPTR